MDEFVAKLNTYAAQSRMYHDPEKQVQAVDTIPEFVLSAGGSKAKLRALLRWFKSDFFQWTDSPTCTNCCQKADQHEELVHPEPEELQYGGSRVEAWRCTRCHQVVRFARYSDPAKLLQTRHGRCGEWANCFALMATAICGTAVRLCLDWTDHVWIEALLNGKWTHCDPCEAAFNVPLTYELGWGKKLTYVIAFSSQEVVDVTARYSSDWPATIARRSLITESNLAQLIRNIDQQQRCESNLPIPPWRDQEEEELKGRQQEGAAPTAGLLGRQSGSAEWRRERGELRANGLVLHVRQESCSVLVEVQKTACALDCGEQLRAVPVGQMSVISVGSLLCADCRLADAAVLVQNVPDGFCGGDGFTVEAWVMADPHELKESAYCNPVVSRHGCGCGWELRLCHDGSAVFLVTIDRVHYETIVNTQQVIVEKAGCRWMHVAGTFNGKGCSVFTNGVLVGEVQLPAGVRNGFDGPIAIGMNPQWQDRHTPCVVHSVRISNSVQTPASFLPPPTPKSQSESDLTFVV